MSDVAPTMWDLGRYELLASHLHPAAAAIADAAGDGEGRTALDVAAGTGSVALELARRGWRVVATDSSARMVELGTARAREEGLEIEWRHADLADQPLADGGACLVTSSFGIIFGAEPAACVAEAARVLEPGGRLLVSAWPQDGYMAEMTAAMAPFLGGQQPSGSEPQGPMRWGSPALVERLVTPFLHEVRVTRRSLPWRFASPRVARAFLEDASPAHVAAMGAAGDRAGAMMDAVEAHLASLAGPDGRVDVAADYLLAEATR